MLRGFRGTVFYNRCRQPPHVRTILSLAFTRYPSYTYVYTAYEQRLFPFLVVGGGGEERGILVPYRTDPTSSIAAFSLFHLNRRRKRLDWKFFLLPPPPFIPQGTDSSLSSRSDKRDFFFSLSPLSLEKERRTGPVERKVDVHAAKVFTAVRYGEHGARPWWWKAFRRKPTADCIPYTQEAD